MNTLYLSCFSLQDIPDSDIVRVIWICIMRSINMTGKNQMQIQQSIVSKIKTYHKVLAAFVTNGKLELTLLVTLQVSVRVFGHHGDVHYGMSSVLSNCLARVANSCMCV